MKKSYVMVREEWISTDDVEFIDIYEGLQGEDMESRIYFR